MDIQAHQLYSCTFFPHRERLNVFYMECSSRYRPIDSTAPQHDITLHISHVALVDISNGLVSLRWRHNDHAGVSNHQPHGCLLNRLSRRRSKKTSKLRVAGLCAVNSPGTGEFPAQMASNAENVSIWWRHHAYSNTIEDRHRVAVVTIFSKGRFAFFAQPSFRKEPFVLRDCCPQFKLDGNVAL